SGRGSEVHEVSMPAQPRAMIAYFMWGITLHVGILDGGNP
ncbi:MAG: hypothetical protein ACI9MB_004786, partial [Verrucomicrobiales bacterium]